MELYYKTMYRLPEIAYSICSLIAKRYPVYSSEIADLMLKYNF